MPRAKLAPSIEALYAELDRRYPRREDCKGLYLVYRFDEDGNLVSLEVTKEPPPQK